MPTNTSELRLDRLSYAIVLIPLAMMIGLALVLYVAANQ